MDDEMHKLRDSEDDEELMRLLAEVLDMVETVPAAALDAAYAALEMDLLTEELAVLVFDSASSADRALVRAVEAEARLLSFANDQHTIDVELHADGHTIVGQVAPPTEAPLQVESESGHVIDVPTDEFGRFRLTAPDGAIRLRIVGLLVTPWVTR